MIKLVAYTTEVMGNKILIRDSEGESICSDNVNELIHFLNEPYSDRASNTFAIKVFFDLDTGLAPILRKLGIPACKELASPSHTYKNLFYISSKVFSIKDGNQQSYFYHLKQYFIDDEDPEDAETIAGMAQNVMDAFHQMGLKPKKLTSPVAIYESEVLSHMKIPTILDISGKHEELIEYAENCCGRLWIQAYQVGHWGAGEVFEFDVKCYSEDTECLTIKGWKRIIDLKIGELILGFNYEKEKCHFQPVKKLTISPYKGEMIGIHSTKADLLITPNHRVLLQNHIRCKGTLHYKNTGTYGYEEWKVYQAKNIPNGNFQLPISFPIEDRPDFPVSDAILQIIAWINTEGSKSYVYQHKQKYFSQINISQSFTANKPNCQKIIKTLENSALPYRKALRNRTQTYNKDKAYVELVISIKRSIALNLSLEDNIHLIPMWILQNCSLRQLRIYFDTLMDGDGSRTYTNGYIKKSSFYTKLKENTDRMMYLCHLLGHKVHYLEPDTHHSTYQLHITEADHTGKKKTNPHKNFINYGQVTHTLYNGTVCCPTIDDGFLVVRRNGKSCISGNSAYPAIARRLPSLAYAQYTKAKRILGEHEIIREEAPNWGFLKGAVTIYDGIKISPIFYDDGTNLSQRTGTWETFITLHDYKFIKKWGIGEFKIEDGFFIKFTAPVYPMEIPLKRLFNQRGQGGLVNDIAKRISTACGYGKFLEKHEDGTVGHFFNPPYASMVNSLANIQVAEFIYENNLQDDVVHIGVDSVISTKEAKLGDQNRVGMGQWRLSGIGPVLVLSSGRVYHGNKKPQGLNYDQIIELIAKHPRDHHYTANLRRRQTLEESIQLGNLNGLGRMKDTTSSFDLNLMRASTDRYFKDFPQTGEQLLNGQYKSSPLKVNNL